MTAAFYRVFNCVFDRAIPLLLCFFITSPLAIQAQENHQSLLEKVKQQRSDERQRMAQREARFLQEKQNQAALLVEAKSEFERYQRENNPLKQETQANAKTIEELKARIAQRKNEMGDLESVVKQMSRDLSEAMLQSPVSMQLPDRAQQLQQMTSADAGLNLDGMESLWLALQQEMTLAGQFREFDTEVIASDGSKNRVTIQQLGSFTSYHKGEFLRYVPETQELLTLDSGSEQTLQNRLFFQSAQGFHTLYTDTSGGSLLGILEWTPDWRERLEQGGIIGKIILALGAVGLVIILWRLVALAWQRHKIQSQLKQLQTPDSNNALGRILSQVSEHTHTIDISQANHLDILQLQVDEAVLNEVGGVERGLNLLKLLAAIAPLLGLLGTVTGMIVTFQSISFFGTGDPKLMAGGISQALITTVLGLVVAIPLLFGHSFISSLAENIIRRLEEQAAGFVALTVEQKLKSGVASPAKE